MKIITRLFIGLETKDGTDIPADEVIDRISKHVEAGTFYESKGLWNGELENSLVFECVEIEDSLKDYESVESLKEELEISFNQESVMMTQTGADVTF